jgi:acetyl esterase
MQYVWKAYVESEEQHKLPTVVPMAAPLDLLKGLPPVLVITAEKDVLRSEGEAYGKKLKDAGVHTVFVRYLGVGHGFLSTPPLGTQSMAAISQTSDFLRKQWSLGHKL